MCSGVSLWSSRPRPERRLTRGGASSSRGPLTARILTRHCLETSSYNSQFSEDFLMEISIRRGLQGIISRYHLNLNCAKTNYFEILTLSMLLLYLPLRISTWWLALLKWIHICPFDVYFNKNWKVSSSSSGEDQCVSTRALCMHPWTSCILFIKSSEALNRRSLPYYVNTKKRKKNTKS